MPSPSAVRLGRQVLQLSFSPLFLSSLDWDVYLGAPRRDDGRADCLPARRVDLPVLQHKRRSKIRIKRSARQGAGEPSPYQARRE